jgi:hypothetical protein
VGKTAKVKAVALEFCRSFLQSRNGNSTSVLLSHSPLLLSGESGEELFSQVAPSKGAASLRGFSFG